MRSLLTSLFLAGILGLLASTSQVTPAHAAPETLKCTNGINVTVPSDGHLFSAGIGGSNYSVVYDPHQSGSPEIPAKGWWYQPCLPEHPQYFEVNFVVTPGTYKLLGPEVEVYLNNSGNDNTAGIKGKLIADHNGVFTIPATQGKNESWLFVRAKKPSDAGGFSLALLAASGSVQVQPTASAPIIGSGNVQPTASAPIVTEPAQPGSTTPSDPNLWDRFWTGVGKFFSDIGSAIGGFFSFLWSLSWTLWCLVPLVLFGLLLWVLKHLLFGNGMKGLIPLVTGFLPGNWWQKLLIVIALVVFGPQILTFALAMLPVLLAILAVLFGGLVCIGGPVMVLLAILSWKAFVAVVKWLWNAPGRLWNWLLLKYMQFRTATTPPPAPQPAPTTPPATTS